MPPRSTIHSHSHNAHSHGVSYSSGVYTTSTEASDPDWRERHFVLKSKGNSVGLVKCPVDENTRYMFMLYVPDDPECPTIPLTQTFLDPMDFDTHEAFKTLPMLEVWQYTPSGIILKFPD